MEECDAAIEDTGQQRASPIHHQKQDNSVLDDFIKKIVDDLVPSPAVAAESRHRSNDDVDDNHASDETGPRPRSARHRKRYRASLATIAESRTATLRTECVAKWDTTPSAHDLRLCETTPSTIALSSRTSLNSLVSGQSASVQTIFHTPQDWVDDDSDCCKLSEKTDFSARTSSRRKRDVVCEAASFTRDGTSTGVDGETESAEKTPVGMLIANPALPAANFGEEQKEMFDLDHFDRLATNADRDTPGKVSTRSTTEENERDFSEVRAEFDPLYTSVVDPSKVLFDQTDVRIDDLIDGSLGDGIEPAAQKPVVLMQFAVVRNPGAPEFQQTANALQDDDDMIQFDNLPANVTHEEYDSTTAEEPLDSPEVLDVEQMLKFCPIPPTGPVNEEIEPEDQTPARPMPLQASDHAPLIKFWQSINQLKEYRDKNCTDQSDAITKHDETAHNQTRTNFGELVSALQETGTSESQMSPPLSSSSDLGVGDLGASQGHATTGAHEQRLEAEMPLEQAQHPNDSAREAPRLEHQTQEGCDLISFDNSEEMLEAHKTTEESSAGVTSQQILHEMDRRDLTIPLSTSPSQTVSKDTDSRQPEKNPQGRQQECLDQLSGAPTAETQQGCTDEIEIELKKTSSEIRTIRMSSSALLQDFYDLRRTYAAELSRSTQSIARTVAERDSTTCVDSRHRLDGAQAQRIDSAIDLMDATIDEIQKWQTRRRGPPPERDTGARDGVAAKKAVVAAKSKPAEVVVRSATVPSTPAVGRGRTANKPALGNATKRDARAETSRVVRPMTSHVPNRSLDAKGLSRGGQAVSPRRDLLANQTKRPSGDAKSPYVAASKRVQSVRPSVNIPAGRLPKSPSVARLGRAATAKSAKTSPPPRTPEEALHELKQCTQSPATYLQRCLALAQSDVARANKEGTSTKGWTKRASLQRETLGKKSDVAVVGAPLETAAAEDIKTPKVFEPKEIKIPQVRVEISNKETNESKEPVVKVEGPPAVATKPKNRFLTDDDIEKWVKLSTRYARCAELGASLFSSKHSCVGDKESVKSDGSLVRTASDLLMDTLMGTVTSAVSQTASRPKSRAATGTPRTSATVAAKDILSKLSVGDTRCVTHIKTVEKVTRSIDNLVRSMSKIVDSASDKRVCWDSSLDSLPTTPAERDAGVHDEVQEELVEKSRQVVEKMTDTLIKHLGNVPDELDFKTGDDVEPVTQLSMEDVLEQDVSRRPRRAKPRSAESLRRWSDTKSSQLEAMLSRLMQTQSVTSAWGLGGVVDVDAIPESVRTSRHKLATLENIVALLNGINTTCRIRANNVEWDDPVDRPPSPSMAPLPDRSKRGSETGNRGGAHSKNLRNGKPGKKSASLSNTTSKRPSRSVAEIRKAPTSPKSPVDARHSDVDVGKRQGRSISRTSALHERSPSTSSTRSSRCEACIDKARRTAKSDGNPRRRSASNASTGSQSSQASVKSASRTEARKPRSRSFDTPNHVDGAKRDRLSYCDTCDAKRKKAKLAEERGETTKTSAKRSSSATSERRERSLSPPTRRGSSLSSVSSSVREGGVSRPRLSYCDTCDAKRRQAALAEERGETETKPPRRSASKASAQGRTPSPSGRGRDSSVSSTSSLEDAASRRPRYSYCDTCDEKLRRQTPPATPLGARDGRRGASWRSDSTQDLDVTMSRPRVSFSAPLEFSERRRGVATSVRSEAGRPPKLPDSNERRNVPAERSGRPLGPASIVHHLRETDSLLSNLSVSLSRDSTSDNSYSSATFIISDRPSRRARVDLALPKIRHVEGTRSTYKHVLQKAFMDRLDNIIKVQSASSRVNLTPKPSATSSTSMARYTMRSSVQLSSADKYKMRHHIPTATEIRARMKRCCDRMPSTDLFGVAISRESLTRRSSQRLAVDSEQSLGFLDDVDNVEDFAPSAARQASCNRALSATYAHVIRRDRPVLGSTKISRKIQSFIRRDLSSWDKITSECIQSVRRDESLLQIAAAPAVSHAKLPSSSSRFNQSEERLVLALIAALGGSPRNNPTLAANCEPVSVAMETVKAIRRNKKYRQRDDLEQDEVVIPIAHLCSSETLFKTVNAVLKTDTEASVSPVESRSFELASRSSTSDYDSDNRTSDSNTEHVFKPVATSYSDSVRNLEMESVESIAAVCNRDGSKAYRTQCGQVLENVGQFSYSPPERESDTSAALSSSDIEEVESRKGEERDFEKVADISAAASQDAEISGAKSDDQQLKNVSKYGDATPEEDILSSAENVADLEDARTAESDSSACGNTASCDVTSASGSIHTATGPVHVQLSSKTDVSSESLQNITYYDTKEVKEDRISKMKGEVMNNSCKEDENDSCCSIPELLERLELAMPFQHERLAIETDSGMSIPIVDAVTEETMQKLHHAISHLPQESFSGGDEVFSRHHHPNLPLDIRADLELYNECQAIESPCQNHKTGNRTRNNTREGICSIRQTKSLLADKHEPKAGEESRRWIEEADAVVAGSGDTDANETCSESDGASLIVNVSTEVCVTDSVADQSLLDTSCSSILTTRSTASKSEASLASTSEDALTSASEDALASAENEILVELLDQVNTQSQLDLLNSRLEGVVRREQLVEDVVEPRALEWRGTSTVSAVCLTFGAVVVGAVLGLPSLWE